MQRNEQFRKLVNELERQVNASFAPGERLPSRRDLAAMYGVGATTIDRALKSLSKKDLVRPAMRVGWFRTPEAPAANESSCPRRTLRVGILSRYTREEWDGGGIYRALFAEAHRRGVSIVEVPNAHRKRPTPGRSRIQLSRVPWNDFDVALLVDAEDTIVHDASALTQHTVLCVDYDATRLGLDSVAIDDNQVGAIAARHLCELGHQRFAVTEDLNDPGFACDPNITARRMGFEWTIGQLGGTIMPDWRLLVQRRCWKIKRVDYIAAGVARWAAAPLNERPTALFATTAGLDSLVRELARHEIRVPADFSIVTVSPDGQEPQINGIRMTRVTLKVSNLASRTLDAAAALAAERAGPGPASRQPKLALAPSLLIPGQSTAPPPAE